jgi:hypothetical protein
MLGGQFPAVEAMLREAAEDLLATAPPVPTDEIPGLATGGLRCTQGDRLLSPGGPDDQVVAAPVRSPDGRGRDRASPWLHLTHAKSS